MPESNMQFLWYVWVPKRRVLSVGRSGESYVGVADEVGSSEGLKLSGLGLSSN